MNIFQSVKMAWRSIMAKKGRSVLTMLSIFIGIASVMSIVSVMEGMKDFTRAQYAAMGTNVVNVSIYSWSFDEDGNSKAKDYFPDLYNFCGSIKEYVDGVTPNGYASATVTYGNVTDTVTSSDKYVLNDDPIEFDTYYDITWQIEGVTEYVENIPA
ncbi:MAG: ABC transporter permease, partial [Firmicutes bacterium]|nr:ABC transporter permease [Bacillota bacterium]